MHDHADEIVVVVKIRVTEVDLSTVDNWFKVSHVCAFQLAVDVEIKVLEL